MVKPYVARKFRHACGVSCINVSDLSLGSLPLPSWISARASSSHGETVGQSLISRAEQCNRLAFASRTSNCAVTPEEFRTAYPQLLAWIQKTLRDYENNTQPVA